jgi:hypothetical protein
MKTGVSVLGEKTFFLKDKTVAIEVKVGWDNGTFVRAVLRLSICLSDAVHSIFVFFEQLLEIPKPSVKANGRISQFISRVNAVNLNVI